MTGTASCHPQGCHSWGPDQGKGWGLGSPFRSQGPVIDGQQPTARPWVSESPGQSEVSEGRAQVQADRIRIEQFLSYRNVLEATSTVPLIFK